MEPAVRSPRTESAIITDRAQNGAFGLPGLPIFPAAERYWWWKPCRGERNFWMQRREAKIGLRDRKCHQRPNERNDTGENPHRNGLFGAGPEIRGLEGLDGGDGMVRTGCPPHSPLEPRLYPHPTRWGEPVCSRQSRGSCLINFSQACADPALAWRGGGGSKVGMVRPRAIRGVGACLLSRPIGQKHEA